MQKIFSLTFAGIDRSYYLRQLFFGVIVAFIASKTVFMALPMSLGLFAWLSVNTLLYPYSRLVWENIVRFILGENLLFIPAIVLLIGKIITMYICFMMAPVISPLGLAYLYWHNSRAIKLNE